MSASLHLPCNKVKTHNMSLQNAFLLLESCKQFATVVSMTFYAQRCRLQNHVQSQPLLDGRAACQVDVIDEVLRAGDIPVFSFNL